MSKLYILLVSLSIIVIALGVYIFQLNSSASSKQSQQNSTTDVQISQTVIQKPIGGFNYSASGFNPQKLKFRSSEGIDVVLTNSSSKSLFIESDTPEFNITIPSGVSQTISIPKIGVYSFHNKATPTQKVTFEIIP